MLICQFYPVLDGFPSEAIDIGRSLALVRLYLGFFPFVPMFLSSYYSLTIILVSTSSSCFTLAVPMREVYCVEYTPRAWDPRSL